jgi:hypothetical protein
VEVDPPASAADPRIRLVEEHADAESEDRREWIMRTWRREPSLDEGSHEHHARHENVGAVDAGRSGRA